ncbi:hypothetical protein ACFQLX_10850 [Streptomyces polyrhachis]|uniref:Secreted protein n=1 Tax=Streptomyces polyrhachis TaxID=1282885 RepID=A0ABW2GHM7_9ACTN
MNPYGFPPEAPRTRRPVALIAAAALALLAAGGGLGYAYLEADGADRSARTRVWQAPPAAKDTDGSSGEATAHTGLGRTLLPVPEGYTSGPDIGEFGNDVELSGRQAAALFKQGGRGLPNSDRREFTRQVDRMKLEGLAMRSYTKGTRLTVEINIARMSPRATRDFAAFKTRLNQRRSSTRGPAIEGYKDARCFVMKTESDDKLQVMDCTVAKGDTLVTFTAYGVKPLDRKAAAALLAKQLDHIDSPGEAA